MAKKDLPGSYVNFDNSNKQYESKREKKEPKIVMSITNQDLYVTHNGTYKAGKGFTGIGKVTVDVKVSDPSVMNDNYELSFTDELVLGSVLDDTYRLEMTEDLLITNSVGEEIYVS